MKGKILTFEGKVKPNSKNYIMILTDSEKLSQAIKRYLAYALVIC